MYLLHTTSDKSLLNQMIDTVLGNESGEVTVEVNSKDKVLTEVLQERQFEKMQKDNSVLELDLSRTLEYNIPDEYLVSSQSFQMNNWQYQLVIHKGFNNEGIPDKWDDDVFERGVNINMQLRTFAIFRDEFRSKKSYSSF